MRIPLYNRLIFNKIIGVPRINSLSPHPTRYHAVPLLLNLMESHDYHVRMVLLEHLVQFTPLCPREELVGSLLPEVQYT